MQVNSFQKSRYLLSCMICFSGSEYSFETSILPLGTHTASNFYSYESTLRKDIVPHQSLTTFTALWSAVEKNSRVISRN